MLYKQISDAYIHAMKERLPVEKKALSYVIAQLKNKQIELQKELTDTDIIGVIQKEIKSRQETLTYLQETDKADEITEEEAIVALLSKYVPAMLSKDELSVLVKQVIETQNITDIPRQRWEIVKAIMADHKAVVDGRLLQEVIGEYM